MAISPPPYLGPEFPGEANLNTTEDVGRWRMQTPVDEPRAPTKGCSIDMIASKIDSCAKARVFAIIAFNLLVFDGQLSKDRTNWACPFGHCKLNFVDQRDLMQHVLDCPHFSRDGVFCNCCIKDDRFEEHCRHDRAESIASHGTEKSSSKKRNPMRKFSNIFSRNRTESRSSSGSSSRPVSPVSTHRRSSILSLMIPTPSSSGDSRRGSSPIPAESPQKTLEAASPAQQEGSSELLGSEPHTVGGIHELPNLEIPSELPDTARAQELPGPIFDDIMEMSESPTEELSMESMIPEQGVLQAYNTAFTRQMEASHDELPSTNGLESAFQHPHQHQHQHQLFWFMQQLQEQQAPQPHPGLQAPPASHEGMDMTGGSMSNRGSFSIPPVHSGCQQEISSPGSDHISSQTRKDSGDSAYSEASSVMVTLGQTPSPSSAQQRGPSAAHLATSASPPAQIPTAFSAAAQAVGDEDISCWWPDCNYRPTGRRREKHPNYLRKHIDNTHFHRYRVRCPGCGDWLSRSDNLRVHQETACSRARSLGAPYPPHHSARRSRVAQRREWGGGWQGEYSVRT
ncbi:C2H2-type domain-containing protein [Fusarium falciforme]|uniref:C2H2-type domain-containing protein n=1 Tax=Fusarium falciforme TaxID=195108 RepID=UPI0023015EF7|nr:C2H2-type domain-containing protein [Fusarium falciforme]WAO87709.1 C2H2-type domain-containing protein [Fusarium falciforme]